MDIATFGAGCFWCIEAILLNVPGITSIDVGYTGGHIDEPTYKMVCEGVTGHAEVAQIKFDPEKTIYDMRVLNIKEDSIVLCIKNEALQTLILFENELGWILTQDLEVF